ncbi:MAG: hypothetical protein QOC64_1621 [Solirubrobacteraceae bacterium]|jgi:hypothetical protein|nr:hypothetical protein [Solirubrobacteraceae bacterium]
MGALTGTPLGRAALLLTAADLAHALDHVRQGRRIGAEVYGAGVAGWLALAVLLVLVARRHRMAVPYAAAIGAAFAAGIGAVHLLPRWSAFSDPYAAAEVDALAWALAVLPVLAAALLAARAMRARRSPAGAHRPVRARQSS